MTGVEWHDDDPDVIRFSRPEGLPDITWEHIKEDVLFYIQERVRAVFEARGRVTTRAEDIEREFTALSQRVESWREGQPS